MEKTERTVSELASLFRMLQVIPDADNVNKVYQVLLAFCTTWRTIGFDRAFLLLLDSQGGALRGHLAAEKAADAGVAEGDTPSTDSFETLAKKVFDTYEQIDSSDLTLKARTFTVPMDWHRSAVVKAALSSYSVLAERRMSEYSTDPFFDFFASTCYIAVPVRVEGAVTAVLAADNGHSGKQIDIDDVSLVYSLAQQAALSIERLLESSDNKRKFRILRKLQEMLSTAETPEALNEGINLGVSMVCRAVGASGCFLKDLVRKKTVHMKAVDEYTIEAGEEEAAIADSFEEILNRAAGSMKALGGDSQHALLSGIAAETVAFFYATPLCFAGEGLGAMALYHESSDGNRSRERLESKHRLFFDLCAGMIAERLSVLHKSRLVDRSDTMLDEVQSNLVRERDSARAGAHAMEFNEKLVRQLARLREVIESSAPADTRLEDAKELLGGLDQEAAEHREEIEAMRSALAMVNLFAVVKRAVDRWKPKVEAMDVTVESRIPATGPLLLMDEASVETAIANILGALTSCVTVDDRVLVECSTTGSRATICIADTGKGLPGHLLSRLFMPFSAVDRGDEHKSAMSLAGDILHKHAGEIRIKSSPSWKTIIVITFPMAANRDRRRKRSDRRHRRDDRRAPETAAR